MFALRIARLATLLLILAPPTVDAAKIVANNLHVNLETKASGHCESDEAPGLIIGKDLGDYLPPYANQVDSHSACECGEALGSSALDASVDTSKLTFEVSVAGSVTDADDMRGAGVGTAWFYMDFEVDGPVTHALTVQSNSTSSGLPNGVSCQLRLEEFNGPQLFEWSLSFPNDQFTLPGTLEPGPYRLYGGCVCNHDSRELPGGVVVGRGSSTAGMTVTMDFEDSIVVGTETVTLGVLKARFGSR